MGHHWQPIKSLPEHYQCTQSVGCSPGSHKCTSIMKAPLSLITLLAIAFATEVAGYVSPQQSKKVAEYPTDWFHPNTYKGMPYQVGYQVKDHSSYNDFGHQESSDSQGVKGSYRVLLPDGRTQVVTYSVQGNSGYLATVSYEDSNYSPAINNGHKSTSYQAKPNVEYNSNKSTYSPPTTPKPYIAAPYTTTTVPYDHYTTKANRQQYNKASAHNYQQTNKPSVQQYNNKASVKPYPTGAQNYDSTIKPSTQHYQPAEKPSSHLYQTTDEPATQHYQPAQTPNLYHFQAIDKPTTPSYQFPDTAIQHYIVVDKIPAEYYTLAETSIPTAQYLPPNNRKKPQEEVGWPSGSVESYLPKNAVIGQNKGSDNVRTECVVTNAPAPAQWSQISGGQSTSYNVPGNDPPAVSSSSSNTATGTFGQRYSRRKPSFDSWASKKK